MAKFSQGIFKPKNATKYVGQKAPTYRSSWELKVMVWLDSNNNVVNWASEPLKIPYQNPLDGKMRNYIPDLLVKYLDRSGNMFIELWEIKPAKETILELAKSKKDKLALAINTSKWQQASAWCVANGLKFRVITEKDLFGVK